MIVSPNPPLPTTVQQPPTGTLDQADPIWCHVKTEWDHQFVKRANFIPWLRAQLQVDPIDETVSSPEPLLNYVKRRLALAQGQQKLRESANNGQASTPQSSASLPSVQGPSNTSSKVNGTYLDQHHTSSFATHGSFTNGPANLVPSVSSQPPDRAPLTNPGSQLYDHGPSNSSCVTNSQLLVHAPAPSMSYSESSPVSSGGTFSSQLGAIADAHMGNSVNTAPSSMSCSNSQIDGYHCAANDLGANQQYHSSGGQPHLYQTSVQFLQDQSLSNGLQQQQMQPLSFQQTSVQLSPYPSSYANHPSQPNAALGFSASHSHPLQPQNVNQYAHTFHSGKISPYEQFSETHQKVSEHQENTFPCNQQKMDFVGPTLSEGSNNWNPAPVVQIDPTLFTGYKTNYLATQNGGDALPPISPAVDVSPQLTTTSSTGNLSPRRTRSSAAQSKKTVSPSAAPSKTSKAPESESRGTTPLSNKTATETKSPDLKHSKAADVTVSSTDDSSRRTGANSGTNNSPTETATQRKTSLDTSTNRSNPPADHYNRKTWLSRLANVRVELDHISKAPSRSAIKLVKILSMFSISPTPNSGDWSTVPIDGRIEVLSAIKASASQDFYDTWTHESKGLSMLEAWLKGAVQAQEKAKNKETLGGTATDSEALQRESLMTHLLQMLAKLSLTLENLQSHAFAKLVLRINKEQNSNKFSTEVKRLSILLEQKWRFMARVAKSGGSENTANPHTTSTSADTKKRSEAASETNHSKKRKVETTRVPILPTAPSSKSTNDLFGRPDKSKLPAFTKKASEPSPAAPVIQDTFAEAMGLLKGKSASSMSAEMAPFASNVSGKSGKPAKRVRFMADSELCQIKVVERLIYEGEEYETHPVGDARKMDHVEGRFLNSSDKFLEEEMEWETPSEVLLTSETIFNLETSPLTSAEASAQEEREKGLPEVTYEDECSIPDTPNEPVDSAQSSVDSQSTGLPKMMKLGGDLLLDPEVSHLIAKVQADNSMNAPLAADNTVSDLLARLGRGGIAPPEVSTNQTTLSSNPPSMLNLGFDISLLNSISQGGSSQGLYPVPGKATMAPPSQPAQTTQTTDSFTPPTRDNGWGAAAGSASRNRDQRDHPTPYIPTGPSAGVSRSKRRKKGKDGSQPRIPAHDSFGRHIKCKWWPNCPHGSKCFYKHG